MPSIHIDKHVEEHALRRCADDYGCTAVWFRSYADTARALDHFQALIGATFGEYWADTAVSDSFMFSVGTKGFTVDVLYDPQWKCSHVRTFEVGGRLLLAWHCQKSDLSWDYAVERLFPVGEGDSTNNYTDCNVLALYAIDVSQQTVQRGQLRQGVMLTDEPEIKEEFFVYAPDATILDLYPELSSASVSDDSDSVDDAGPADEDA
eukprot:TRINITY_DN646_c0_g1_i1.p1 TRINITY_DN646_c0_g1~~TRINITY_DN646_c0_g1_i1.p1  ORF type:complete len:206 (+),score=30.36 TRINITY_DN646_c0_g1_i1:570-1187(+)